MASHGLIFGENEAYRYQEAFASLPGPPGHQKHAKTNQKHVKNVKNPIFPVYPDLKLSDIFHDQCGGL